MNILDTLRGLMRRWYIVVPGLILAVAGAIGAFTIVKPGYERTATQLMIPGTGILPETTTNPYLFLGGLAPATDILIRAINSESVAGEIAAEYPGVEIEVKRDPTQSGPVVLFTVTAADDADGAAALTELLDRSTEILDSLQNEQNVSEVDRIHVSTLTEDQAGTPQQRTRLMVTAAVGLGMVVVTLVTASLVDGLARKSVRRGRSGRSVSPIEEDTDRVPDAEPDPTPVDAEPRAAPSEPIPADRG